jgi:5-methyltetrahydrofolate--homocysteine methyltransferase
MVTVADEMQRAGMTLPLLIGGATTSKVHTALRIDPAYDGPVLHVLDASRAVGVASSLVSDTQKEPLIELTRDDYQKVRDARAGKGQNELATIAEARANAHPFEPSGVAPVPAKPGLHRFDEWPLDDLRQLIDWTPFFRAWELAGNYPAILAACSPTRRPCSTASSPRNGSPPAASPAFGAPAATATTCWSRRATRRSASPSCASR